MPSPSAPEPLPQPDSGSSDEAGEAVGGGRELVGAQVAEAPTMGVRDIVREFWPDTRGFRRRMALGLLLIPIPPLLAAAGIWLFKILVDDVLTPRNFELFVWVAAAFVVITLAEGLFGFVDEYLSAWVAERFVLVLRGRVFAHLHRLSLSFFDRHQLGDLLARLTGDVSAIEALLLSGVNQALTYSFQILFFAGALFVLDWRLALAALVGTPLFLLLARTFARRIKRASREQRRHSGMISAVAEESLHNVALVQAYGRQEHESARFRRHSARSFTSQMVAVKIEALFNPFTDLLEVIGVLGVVGYGLHELNEGRITLGGLIVFIGYLTQLYGPVNGFGSLTNQIFAASAGAERVIELLHTEPEVREPAEPISVGRARGSLACDDVSFRYPGNERPALHRVSFRADPGQTVAIVGASGAGKSSLARVLLRLHDPSSGSVRLDGVELNRIPLAELRDNVAVVLQETLVFDGTVAENIRWGRPDASDADVTAAATAADAHAFITALPAGYQTRIGQRGMMLSGGQRQRIALARAMIRDAPVLVLDEPTTGLDALSTQRVLEPLRRAMAGRTTVVISHNLLTVTEADRIVFLDRGRVTGIGTHDELMMSTPGYAQLYRLHHPATLPARRPDPRTPPAHPGRPATPRARRPVPTPRARAIPAPGAADGRAARPVPMPRPAPARSAPAPRVGGSPGTAHPNSAPAAAAPATARSRTDHTMDDHIMNSSALPRPSAAGAGPAGRHAAPDGWPAPAPADPSATPRHATAPSAVPVDQPVDQWAEEHPTRRIPVRAAYPLGGTAPSGRPSRPAPPGPAPDGTTPLPVGRPAANTPPAVPPTQPLRPLGPGPERDAVQTLFAALRVTELPGGGTVPVPRTARRVIPLGQPVPQPRPLPQPAPLSAPEPLARTRLPTPVPAEARTVRVVRPLPARPRDDSHRLDG